MNRVLGFSREIVAVVIGSSGGVGDAFVQKLSRSTQCKKLIMTARQPMVLGEVDSKHTWLSMDITNEESISSVASYIQNQNIDLDYVKLNRRINVVVAQCYRAT